MYLLTKYCNDLYVYAPIVLSAYQCKKLTFFDKYFIYFLFIRLPVADNPFFIARHINDVYRVHK